MKTLHKGYSYVWSGEGDPYHCSTGEAHDKCFSNMTLTSSPPQYPWICRRCGLRGVDVAPAYDYGEYDRLAEQWDGAKKAKKASL